MLTPPFLVNLLAFKLRRVRRKRRLLPKKHHRGKFLGYNILPEDLQKFGLIPEFVGRVPIIVTLHQLEEEALIRILTEPRNALTRQYKKLFEMDGVELEFDHEALVSVATEAMARKTGARGLRAI